MPVGALTPCCCWTPIQRTFCAGYGWKVEGPFSRCRGSRSRRSVQGALGPGGGTPSALKLMPTVENTSELKDTVRVAQEVARNLWVSAGRAKGDVPLREVGGIGPTKALAPAWTAPVGRSLKSKVQPHTLTRVMQGPVSPTSAPEPLTMPSSSVLPGFLVGDHWVPAPSPGSSASGRTRRCCSRARQASAEPRPRRR